MAVARQYQQPRSIILGRVRKPGEPLWLPLDLEWALEYERYVASICPGCGTPRHAWDGARPGELPFVGVTRTCGGCEEKGITEEEIPEEQRKPWHYVEMVPGGVFDAQRELDEANEMLADYRAGLRLPAPARAG